MLEGRFEVRVSGIVREAEGICAYELVPLEGEELPAFTAGAHVEVTTPGGFTRPYSLCGDPADVNRWTIGVLREADGRGGSRDLHDRVRPGDVLRVGPVRNHFPLVEDAPFSLLVAGGIGITPLLCMARVLAARGARWSLLYFTRSRGRTAFRDALAAPAMKPRVRFHHDDDPTQRIDLARALSDRPAGAHLYACGPPGFLRAVTEAAWAAWPSETVHVESFRSPPTGDDRPFTVRVRSTGEELHVPAGRTLLSVLSDNDYFVPTSCGVGSCGLCLTGVVEGRPEHRDVVLTPDERREGLTVCCSRAAGDRLTLDL